MKSEELMVGDWVFDEQMGIPVPVCSIREGREHHCRPIPLTPEILEKNGFVEEEYPIIYDRREFELRHGDYRIIVSPLNDGYTRIYKGCYLPILNNCYINFVHELQHALRLCKIDKTIEL